MVCSRNRRSRQKGFIAAMVTHRTRVILFLLTTSSSLFVVFSDVGIDPASESIASPAAQHATFASQVTADSEVSSQCNAEISRLINGDPKTLGYDIVMALDAFGKPPAGVLQMNWQWLGHYDECMAIDGFNYCLVFMNINVNRLEDSKVLPGKIFLEKLQKTQIDIKWGTCVPANCTNSDVNTVLRQLLSSPNLLDGIIPVGSLQETSALCTKQPSIPYSAGVICTIILCCFIASLMLLGALYDEYIKLQMKKTQSWMRLFAGIASPLRLLDETDESVNNGDDIRDDGKEGSIRRENEPSQKQSLAMRILLCFALNRNLTKLMDTRESDSSVRPLNGIRVISMLWVILYHTAVLHVLNKTSDNIPTLANWIQNHVGFQVVANGTFSVDSFFLMSGFLVAFLSFSRFRELRSFKAWFLFYFHRYWRLTPLCAFTILVYMYIPQFLGYGPMLQTFVKRPFCSKYWWTNLLYINNFWPKSLVEGCIPWTWHLASDMQFFIISPLFMALLFYFPVIGWLALSVALLTSFVTTALIIGLYDLSIITRLLYIDFDFGALVYNKPYCRIAPYLVGIGLGYIMHRIGKRKVKMSPIFALIGWMAATILAISVVFGLYPAYKTPPMTNAVKIVYGSVSRFVWALSLAWVVFACRYGYGGWINSFLSWRAWVPLARVTYAVCLVHIIVIYIYFFNFAAPLHFSVYLLTFRFAAVVSISYVVGVFLVLAIEYPFANLEKIFLPSQAKRIKDAHFKTA